MKKLYCLIICFLGQVAFLNAQDPEIPDYLFWTQDQGNSNLLMGAEDNHVQEPNCLVFAGSAVKGIAYLGAIRYFLEQTQNGVSKKDFNKIIYLAGASSGAIIASVISSLPSKDSIYKTKHEWSDDEIKNIVINLATKVGPDLLDPDPIGGNVNDLRELILDPQKHLGPIRIAKALPALLKGYGICKGKKLRDMVNDAIVENLKFYFKGEPVSKNPTFGEIYQLTGHKLVIFASSLTRKTTAIYSWFYTPDFPVADAVRASMAFPGVFQPYVDTRFKINDYLVDGGCQIDFPIDFFDNAQDKDWGKGLSKDDLPRPLGVISSLEPKPTPIEKFPDFLSAILIVLTDTAQSTIDINKDRVIRSDAEGVPSFAFGMAGAQKGELIQNCYLATGKYCEGNEFKPGKKIMIPDPKKLALSESLETGDVSASPAETTIME